METAKVRSFLRLAIQAAAWVALFYLLYVIGTRNYLLFHVAAELFSVVIAFMMFGLAWNVRDNLDNQSVLLLGVSYAFVAVIDIAHTLSFKGMGVFPLDEANNATQLWLAARYMQAGALLAAPFYARRRLPVGAAIVASGVVTSVLLLSIFQFDLFPDAFIEGQGLTPFKINSEYVISGLLVIAFLLFYARREAYDPTVRYYLGISIFTTILSELMFTTYASVSDIFNMFGHFFKIIAFYMIYKAVVEIGLRRPFELLFRNVKTTADALQKERDFVSAVLDTGHALVLVLDSDGMIVRVNRAVETTTGYSANELVGQYVWETPLADGEPEEVRALLRRRMETPEPSTDEVKLQARDGSIRYIAWTNALMPGTESERGYIISTGIDITGRRQAEEDLRVLATHDVLTGLYNRAYFEEELSRFTRSDRFPVSIIVMDVDGLKKVNDTQGHAAGDRLLQLVAKVLREAFRVEDVVARIGGDEFGVLLPGADAAAAQQSQDRLRAVEAEFNRANLGFPISISSGWATARSGELLDESLREADRAMYLEKLSRQNSRASRE